MESFREQRCRSCLGLFFICPCCDRGQVYCGEDCQKRGRATQVRLAKRKYLADPDVREGERDRQREHRARVRDQGSEKVDPRASVPIDATLTPMTGGGDRDEGSDHASQESLAGPSRSASVVSPPPPAEGDEAMAPCTFVGPAPPIGLVRPTFDAVRCAFCGRGAQFVRVGPLRRWRKPRWQIRGRAP